MDVARKEEDTGNERKQIKHGEMVVKGKNTVIGYLLNNLQVFLWKKMAEPEVSGQQTIGESYRSCFTALGSKTGRRPTWLVQQHDNETSY